MKNLIFPLFLLFFCHANVVRAEENTQPFSENEAIAIAIKKNPALEELRLATKEAKFQLLSKKALYPWVLNADGGFRFDEQPTADVIQSGTRKSIVFQGGVELLKQFTFGTSLSARLDMNRSTSEIPFTLKDLNIDEIRTIGPNYGSSLRLQVNQPLMRGFGKDLYQIPEVSSKHQLSLSQLKVKQQAADLISQVLQAYWTWVKAKWEFQSSKERLKRSQWLEKATDAQIQAGTLAELEHDIVEQQSAVVEQALISAEMAITDAEDDLQSLLSDFQFKPREVPTDLNIGTLPSLESSLKSALQNSPDLALLKIEMDTAKLALVKSKNETKAKLDAVASLTQSGLSENVLESLGQVGTLDFTSLFVGLSFSIPLDNSKNTKQFEADQVRIMRAKFNKRAAVEKVETQIRKAHRFIQMQQKRSLLSRKEITFAKKNLTAIREKFSAGRASHLEVLQIEEDLLNAETRSRASKIDLILARIKLNRLDGSILEKYNLEFKKN